MLTTLKVHTEYISELSLTIYARHSLYHAIYKSFIAPSSQHTTKQNHLNPTAHTFYIIVITCTILQFANELFGRVTSSTVNNIHISNKKKKRSILIRYKVSAPVCSDIGWVTQLLFVW